MCHFEALYGRRCRYPIGWFEVGESSLLGPELIYMTLEKVHIKRNHIKTACSRQKSYAENRSRDLDFEKGDKVYLKISPMKGVEKFGKKKKLIPRYVGPYEILQRVGKVEYELRLPSELTSIHPAFHLSLLKKCIGNPESILPIEGLRMKEDLSYEEVPV